MKKSKLFKHLLLGAPVLITPLLADSCSGHFNPDSVLGQNLLNWYQGFKLKLIDSADPNLVYDGGIIPTSSQGNTVPSIFETPTAKAVASYIKTSAKKTTDPATKNVTYVINDDLYKSQNILPFYFKSAVSLVAVANDNEAQFIRLLALFPSLTITTNSAGKVISHDVKLSNNAALLSLFYYLITSVDKTVNGLAMADALNIAKLGSAKIITDLLASGLITFSNNKLIADGSLKTDAFSGITLSKVYTLKLNVDLTPDGMSFNLDPANNSILATS